MGGSEKWRRDYMKKHLIIIMICMLILVPQLSAYHCKEQKKILFTEVKENIGILTVEDELPIWKNGDSWTYRFDFSFEIEEEGFDIDISIRINDLQWTVISESGSSYQMDLEGNVQGNFFIDVESIPRITATLQQTQLDGTAFIEKQNLGMQSFDMNIDGKIKFGIIPVSLELVLSMDFNPTYSPLDFPLYPGKQWTVNGTTIMTEGYIQLTGISTIFPDIPDRFDIPEIDPYISENIATCSQKENITVDFGTYEAYNISIGTSHSIFYGPIAGSFLTYIPLGEGDDTFDASFQIELRSTNYKVPGAPELPNPPTGPTQGRPNNEFSYQVSTTDPENNEIYYVIDWGDGTNTGWLGPYQSGASCQAAHTWSERGSYAVKVRAKDTENHETQWSDPLYVSMPKYRDLRLIPRIIQLIEEKF